MKIGDVAKAAGISVQTVRLYEKDGLIQKPDRTDGQTRVFREEDVRNLILIRKLRSIGISSEEVRAILAAQGGEPLPEDVRIGVIKMIMRRKKDLADLEAILQP